MLKLGIILYSAFVSYEELWRSRRVLSASANVKFKVFLVFSLLGAARSRNADKNSKYYTTTWEISAI